MRTVLFFRIAVFILLAFFPHTSLAPVTANSPLPPSLSSVVVSNGWQIVTFALNNLGTVVFAGRQIYDPVGADGLVLVRSNEFRKFVAVGDPVPGFPNTVFANFLSGNSFDRNRALSLNDRDEVAFWASFITCPSGSDVYKCRASHPPGGSGIFLYSKGTISKVILSGEKLSDTAGGLLSFPIQLWLNNRGDILFSDGYGLFTYSAGQVRKIALEGDPTPLGVPLHFLDRFNIVFNDEGVITFYGSSGYGSPGLRGVFHFSGTTFIKDLAEGDSAPGGGTFLSVFGITSNGEGDVAFIAKFRSMPSDIGLFLRRRDGTVVRIIADGDPSPLGGTFTLWYTATGYNRGGSYTYTVYTLVPPQLNKFGHLVFAAPVKGGTASGGVFLYTSDGIKVLAADGDPGPPETNANFVFFSRPPNTQPALSISVAYAIDDFDTVVLLSGLSNGPSGFIYHGISQLVRGRTRKVVQFGNPVPGTERHTFSLFYQNFLQNDRGDVAFMSGLCCDKMPPDLCCYGIQEGLFLFATPALAIPNGDFEIPGDTGLPANWPTVWHASGDGDAYRYDSGGADAFRGISALRLHVNVGGGSTFVLSDEIPVSPDSTYFLSSWMRYSLASTDDAVFFSVLQFDASGNVVGFDEVPGVQGENYWQWEPKRLLIHTSSATSSVRIRFGLMSATESYLDVDSVQ